MVFQFDAFPGHNFYLLTQKEIFFMYYFIINEFDRKDFIFFQFSLVWFPCQCLNVSWREPFLFEVNFFSFSGLWNKKHEVEAFLRIVCQTMLKTKGWNCDSKIQVQTHRCI